MIDNIPTNNSTIPENTVPTMIAGRYRVIRKLGEGGMGSVWLAEDTKLKNRRVAIKMLPSILVSNKRAYEQVQKEALVTLKLTHSNIATVRAFEEDNGNPFLVMDYIDGQALDDYLAEKGALTEDETIKLLKPIADALDYAHTQDVVHRDVKPGNVMIGKDGAPYILDFGIAREVQETMTRVTGKLSSGTLMYMSPEQLNGEDPTVAQDVYSFAAMAYECLKGKPPFSRGQVEFQIVNNPPAPLGPQFIKCGLGVMAGLAKTPDERPKSCVAVLMGAGKRGSNPIENADCRQKMSGETRNIFSIADEPEIASIGASFKTDGFLEPQIGGKLVLTETSLEFRPHPISFWTPGISDEKFVESLYAIKLGDIESVFMRNGIIISSVFVVSKSGEVHEYNAGNKFAFRKRAELFVEQVNKARSQLK